MVRLAILLAAGLATSGVAGAQGLSEIERRRGQVMLNGLKDVLQRRYYDSTFGGRNLDSMWWRASSAIDTATAWPTVLAAHAQFLQGLNDSHTRFRPPGFNIAVNFGWSWRMIGEHCYVTEVRRGADAERKGLRVGDRIMSLDGIRPDRQGMRLVWYVYHVLSPRRGMRLYVERADGTREGLTLDADVRRVQGHLDLNNLEHLRILWDDADRSGNVEHRFRMVDSVATWRFSWWRPNDRWLDSYMRRAQSASWLIIDLRGNPGGAVISLTRLLGYFANEEVHAWDARWRDSTRAHRVSPVSPGFRGQVIVLIDSESASASEIFSRTLQQWGRAMIVGDRSAGAVMASIGVSLAERSSGDVIPYGMSVTIYDVIMRDGSRLEHAGVLPDVLALPMPADLAAGRDPALQFALELAGIRVSADEAARFLR